MVSIYIHKLLLLVVVILLSFSLVSAVCTEDDGGNRPFTAGTAQGNYYGGPYEVKDDYCVDAESLVEYYCDSGSLVETTISCEENCQDGVCERSEFLPDTEAVSFWIGKYSKYFDLQSGTWKNDDGGAWGPGWSGRLGTCKEHYVEATDIQMLTTSGLIKDWKAADDSLIDSKKPIFECIKTCDDTDDGIRATLAGSVTSDDGASLSDNCQDAFVLNEAYCDTSGKVGLASWKELPCEYGCQDGACIAADDTERIAYATHDYLTNMHYLNGEWEYTVVNGQGIYFPTHDQLSYCQLWWPDTLSVRPYKEETLTFQHRIMNPGLSQTQTVTTIQCVRPGDECTDIDRGENVFIQAKTLFTDDSNNIDTCLDANTLREYTCPDSFVDIACPYGCQNGACIQGNDRSCLDPDMKDTSTKTTVTGTPLPGITATSDTCHTSFQVDEFYCTEDDYIAYDRISCDEGFVCQNGACIPEHTEDGVACREGYNCKKFSQGSPSRDTANHHNNPVLACRVAFGNNMNIAKPSGDIFLKNWRVKGTTGYMYHLWLDDGLGDFYRCETGTCTDPDNQNEFVKTTTEGPVNGVNTQKTDLCINANTVREYYCENNRMRSKVISCDHGCDQGACTPGSLAGSNLVIFTENYRPMYMTDTGEWEYSPSASRYSTINRNVLSFCKNRFPGSKEVKYTDELSLSIWKKFLPGDNTYTATGKVFECLAQKDQTPRVADMGQYTTPRYYDGNSWIIKPHSLKSQDLNDVCAYAFAGAVGVEDQVYTMEFAFNNYELSWSNSFSNLKETKRCIIDENAMCTDTDKGQNKNFVKGTVTSTTAFFDGENQVNSATDTCVDTGTLREYSCVGVTASYKDVNCACENGACVDEVTCTDSEQSANLFQKGFITGVNHQGRRYTSYDYCRSSQRIKEYYCKGSSPYATIRTCAYGCEDGACKKSAQTPGGTTGPGSGGSLNRGGSTWTRPNVGNNNLANSDVSNTRPPIRTPPSNSGSDNLRGGDTGVDDQNDQRTTTPPTDNADTGILRGAADEDQVSTTYWTRWFDRDNPGGYGDYEGRRWFPICDEPTDIQCKTVDGVDWKDTGEAVSCTTRLGLSCVNKRQSDGRCEDYKIRFLCPRTSGGVSP